jgi:hypothetical protein
LPERLRRLRPASGLQRLVVFASLKPSGGVMMNFGYDPDPSGFYETPPIAPQMWHSYHIEIRFGILGDRVMDRGSQSLIATNA